MSFPKEKEEILELVKRYHAWFASGGCVDLYPKELSELESRRGIASIVVSVFFHSLLFLLVRLFKYLRVWPLVALFAKLRIITDAWSIEPRQCGYNQAYTLLGIYRLRKNDIVGAISALKESWQVYPCPHNTSFGLFSGLANRMGSYAECKPALEEFWEVFDAFKA